MSNWTITPPSGGGTPVPLADLNLTLASGRFATQEADELTLTASTNFDASLWWSYDSIVTLHRDGSPWFCGRVATRPRQASASAESINLTLRGPWADLETLIYAEPWQGGAGAGQQEILIPQAVLGISPTGQREDTAQTLARIINFAIGKGANLQWDNQLPAGIMAWPTEAKNQSCADLIRELLKWHPDLTIGIDHSTTPKPTLRILSQPSAELLTIPSNTSPYLTGINLEDNAALTPDGVKITYITANEVDGELVRTVAVDTAGSISNPRRTMEASVELSGLQMQTQKSQIRTRKLPENDKPDTWRVWLKKKYPVLADLDDADWGITDGKKKLHPAPKQRDQDRDGIADNEISDDDEDKHAPPIYTKYKHPTIAEVDELPRELVEGSLAEWMRRKVGSVHLEWTLQIKTSDPKKRKILAAIPNAVDVTATNAITKIYRSMTQYTPADDAPVGIAAAFYAATRKTQWSGNIDLAFDSDLPATPYHLRAINLEGGMIEWSTMNARVTSYDFDVAAGTASLTIGTAPHLSLDDFLALQKLLNSRPVSQYSTDERKSNRLGAQNSASSKGDTVSGYFNPSTTPYHQGGGGGEVTGPFWDYYEKSGKAYLRGGIVAANKGTKEIEEIELGTIPPPPTAPLPEGQKPPTIHPDGHQHWLTINLIANTEDEFPLAGCTISSATPNSGSNIPDNNPPEQGSPNGTFIIPLGDWFEGTFRPANRGHFYVDHCNWTVRYEVMGGLQ